MTESYTYRPGRPGATLNATNGIVTPPPDSSRPAPVQPPPPIPQVPLNVAAPQPPPGMAPQEQVRIIRHLMTLFAEGAIRAEDAARLVCREVGVEPPKASTPVTSRFEPAAPEPAKLRPAPALKSAAKVAAAKKAAAVRWDEAEPKDSLLTTQQVNDARLRKGITLRDIAEQSGVSRGTLENIARNKSVTQQMLRRVLDVIEAS